VAQFEPVHLEWRKSTASQTSNCVEVAFVGQSVLVRHSRDESGSVLIFSHAEWAAFLTGARNGEFDHHPD
jgi:hypothetical protein